MLSSHSSLSFSVVSFLSAKKLCVGDAKRKTERAIAKAKQHIIKKSKHKKLQSPCRHQIQAETISFRPRIGADCAGNSPQRPTDNHLPLLLANQTIVSSPTKQSTPIKSHSPGKPVVSPLVKSERAKQEKVTPAPHISAGRACISTSNRRLSTLWAQSEVDSPNGSVVKCRRRLMFPSESCDGKNGRFQPPIVPPVPEHHVPTCHAKSLQSVKVCFESIRYNREYFNNCYTWHLILH